MKARIIHFLIFFFTLNVAWGQVIITKPKTSTQKTETTTGSKPTEKPKGKPRTTISSPTGTQNGHGWVDLGLPSGTKWATMNIGANSPSDYGVYFSWGETETRSGDYYDGSDLKYCLNSKDSKFSKYVIDNKYGIVDGKEELDFEDDAAYMNWGIGWRMPSKAQLDELCEKCKWTWTSLDGHEGYKVVGPNGHSIFLPTSTPHGNSHGSYWSRSLHTFYGSCAYSLCFNPSYVTLDDYVRSSVVSIRPILEIE